MLRHRATVDATVPERFPDLAHSASQLEDPARGLAAVAALRGQLQALEASHVDRAFRDGWSWSRIASSLGVTKQAAHKKHAMRLRAPPPASPVSRNDRAGLVVTGQARRSVRLAREEATALGQTYVGVEHLLLGLLRDRAGPAAEALASVGVTLEAARREIEWVLDTQREVEVARFDPHQHAAAATDLMPVSTRAREVMEQSLREAVRLGSPHLGVEHMLLALLRNRSGTMVLVLARLGLSPVVLEHRLDETLAAASAG